jgi:hypothetical protein
MKMKSEQASTVSIWSNADSDFLSRLWWYGKYIFQRLKKIRKWMIGRCERYLGGKNPSRYQR